MDLENLLFASILVVILLCIIYLGINIKNIIIIFFLFVAAFAASYAYAKYYQGGSYSGGLCDRRDFQDTFDRTERGYKHEAMIRRMLNCYVNRGQFDSVVGSPQGLDWLYADEPPPTNRRSYADRSQPKNNKIYLELDGWNPEAGIAFEFQGRGHYENVYGNMNRYYVQRTNDGVKKKKLQEKGYPLIILHHKIDENIYSDYVKSRLHDLGCLKDNYYRFDRDRNRVPNFTYINVIPEPPVQGEKYLKNVVKVVRKGAQSEVYSYVPKNK